ncbi:MAG: metalloregulator ArsR/SmtB family transcription factor [Ignavibacteriales bacterium]|nr:metalloregulator ArsR/SmtB family transcription factor [Ignavibacteriales bacterium]
MKRDYVNVFKALSDPNRIRIVKMLCKRELCMCEVREMLNLSNSTVSQHLTILRNADLLLDSKEGKWVNFRINDKSDRKFIRSTINLIKNSFEDDDIVQADLKKVFRVDRIKITKL